jgi:adenine/guanine/hypoxanthine permease
VIPNIASWAQGQIDNALGAAGTSAAQVGEAKLEANSVVYHGLLILGSGAVLAGMVLGAIVVFVVDRTFVKAGIVCVIAAALSFVGIINAETVKWNADGEVTLGFLFAAVVCFAFALTRPEPRIKDAQELALEAQEGGRPAGAAPSEAEAVPAQTAQVDGAEIPVTSPVAG